MRYLTPALLGVIHFGLVACTVTPTPLLPAKICGRGGQ